MQTENIITKRTFMSVFAERNKNVRTLFWERRQP